ncbi:MAG: hypothetical protein AB1589_07685 [Cyanobacteriota bacterium]
MSETNASFIKVIFMVLCGALFATSTVISDTWKDINSSNQEQPEALAPQTEVLP